MNRYYYDGPVMIFNRCAASIWHGETVAATEKKAKSNLAYQYRKECGLTPSASVSLPAALQKGL